MKKPEIHCLWVTKWVIIEERWFLYNKYKCGWSLMKYFNIQWIWSYSKLQNVSHLLLLMATSSNSHFKKHMKYKR